jgi:protein-tyrosine phosphatase
VAGPLRAVRLDAEGAGLRLSWELHGAPRPAEVGVGTTPVAAEHTNLARVPAGVTELVLPDMGGGRRWYASLAVEEGGEAVVVGERRLTFEGPTNFRDLGGYEVEGGGRTRWGRVYRSDSLHRFSPADVEAFAHLGARAVYDLRSFAERVSQPGPVGSVHLDVLGADTAQAAVEVLAARTPAQAERVLLWLYRAMMERSAAMIGGLLGRLAREDLLPAVLHCTEGKDRTGVVSALLLSALGVPRATVLDDYVLTGRFRNAEHEPLLMRVLQAAGVPEEAAAAFLGSPRWVMEEVLSGVERDHGSVEGYLLGPAGMVEGQLEGMRRLLVGPEGPGHAGRPGNGPAQA